MASREAKLRRLNDFRRSKAYCSASALAQILTDIKKHGLPELTDRNSMRDARNLVTATPGAYGSILQTMDCVDNDGAVQRIPIANPFASWSAAVEESCGFRAFLKQQLQLHPSSPETPWSLIVYTDEVTPGNPLTAEPPEVPIGVLEFRGIRYSSPEPRRELVRYHD